MVPSSMNNAMDPGSSTSPPPVAGPSTELAHEEVPDEEFDIDTAELMELYKRIPTPDLRGHAMRAAQERIIGNVVRTVKDDGIFDNFRKAWLKDLETKVSFHSSCVQSPPPHYVIGFWC